MPFTFSHPAIVLPLTRLPRTWISTTGLVIGSMTPDFEYFLRMKIQGHYGHTIPGIFLMDLPVGLALAFIFHDIVRNGLFDNLPGFLRSRFTPFKEFDWNRYFRHYWPAVIISILIGAASHLFWDAFTHVNGYFVRQMPFLKTTVHVFGIGLALCRVFQHLSTFAGALTIAYVISALPTKGSMKKEIDMNYWIVLIALTMVIIAVRILAAGDIGRLANVLVTAVGALFISLALTPGIIALIGRRR